MENIRTQGELLHRKDPASPPMRGTLLWFNEDKNRGVIEAADGERLPVDGAEFAEGSRPSGRCGGTVVAFRIVDPTERRAADVTLVVEVVPRRARRRHGRSFR